ncbi:hypothetical protein SDC9_170420 [bioreactor metagenome]|uniref:Uncharacterized protein n=1 Tax=bioreactor metagenome TaxID=1076179 RepID=A0A645G8R9_9ZZZZ
MVAAGVSVTATNFIISNGSYVSAHGTLMKWQASGNRTIYIEGTKYAFSDSNGNGTTEYDGDYYAYSNYTSHNSNFANLFYERMWGNDVFDIVSWS